MKWPIVSPARAGIIGACSPILGLWPAAAVIALQRGIKVPFRGPVPAGWEAFGHSPLVVLFGLIFQPAMTITLVALGLVLGRVAYQIARGDGPDPPSGKGMPMPARSFGIVVVVCLAFLADLCAWNWALDRWPN